jgi:tape measure domain-containing protein
MADKKTLELQIQVLANQAQQQIKLFATDIKNAASQVKEFTKNNQDIKNAMGAIQAEAQRATNSLKLFGGSASELRNQTQKMKSVILDLVENGLDPESDEIKNLVKQYKDLDAQIEKTETQQEGLAGTFQNLTKEIGTLAAVTAAVSFDKWVAGLAGSALSASTSFRAAKEDFGIMLGDMEAGAGLFAELQEFNFWTPFDLEQTSQAAKVLMAAKVPLKDMTEYLTRFGDISQGNGQRFQSFINAFSKASAKGKADMEVLNVYIDQGVQILDALGEQMGVTSAEIVDMASKGKVSFQDLDNALASLAAEGGLYYNSMATASQRLDAMQAGLEESVNALAASYGDMLAPMAAKALEVFTNLIDTINNSPFLKGVLAAALAAVVVIINTQMIRALVAFAAKIWATYAAQMSLTSALSITNPLLLAGIAAVATATAGYVAYAAAQQKATEATNEHALAKKQLDQAFKDSMANASATDAQLAIENYSRQIAMQKTILEQYKKQLTNTPAETWQSSASGYSTVKVANPEYKKIQDNIAATEQKLKDFENRVDEARKRVQGLQVETVNAELERANEILAHRDQLYKSTTEYQREQVAQELEFAKSLRTIQTMNKDGTYSGFDKAKTEAIIRDLEEQMEKLTPKLGNEWQVKMLQGKDKVMHEWNQAIETLNQKGKNVFGEGFVNEPAFKAEMDALNEYFQKQIDNMKENGKISVSFGESASQAATDATSGSDLGIIVSGIQNGESIWAILIKIILSVVQELESFQKAINIISTALRTIFERLEPLLDDMTTYIDELIGNLVEVLGPLLAIITAIINSSLKPIFQIINTILEVLKPVIELFVMLYNVIATVINFLGDFVGIHLDIINFSTEVQRATDELDKHTTMMQKKYERQAQAVEDLLQSQLESLRSQYELGLISREEYESQAEKYAADADSKIYDINKEMNEKLGAIEANTYAVLSDAQKASSKNPLHNLTTGLVDNVKKGNWGAAIGDILTGGLGSWFGWWDIGSYNIPQDQIGMVHKGEIIVPKTFAEGIRKGELSLGSGSQSNQSSIVVNLNVAGSVATENEIVEVVYRGIQKGIAQNKYNPLAG